MRTLLHLQSLHAVALVTQISNSVLDKARWSSSSSANSGDTVGASEAGREAGLSAFSSRASTSSAKKGWLQHSISRRVSIEQIAAWLAPASFTNCKSTNVNKRESPPASACEAATLTCASKH